GSGERRRKQAPHPIKSPHASSPPLRCDPCPLAPRAVNGAHPQPPATRLHFGGAVAQLGERLVRNEEVRGSTPLGSTIRRFAAAADRPSPQDGWPAKLQR